MIATNDETAIYILKTIAQARLQSGAGELPDAAGVRAALAGAFGDLGSAPASEGELARAALELLAAEEDFAEPIRVMVGQGGPGAGRKYLEPSTIALTTAVLLALQTRVKFKMDHKRQWSVEIDKRAGGDGLVKGVVERLLSVMGR